MYTSGDVDEIATHMAVKVRMSIGINVKRRTAAEADVPFESRYMPPSKYQLDAIIAFIPVWSTTSCIKEPSRSGSKAMTKAENNKLNPIALSTLNHWTMPMSTDDMVLG